MGRTLTGDEVLRGLRKNIGQAVREHGAIEVVNAIFDGLDALDRRGNRAGSPGRRRGVVRNTDVSEDDDRVLAARKRREEARSKARAMYAARKSEDRERRANEQGEAIGRGRPPRIVTREVDD